MLIRECISGIPLSHTRPKVGLFLPWVQLDRKEDGREELVPRLSGMCECQGMHGCSVLWECEWAGLVRSACYGRLDSHSPLASDAACACCLLAIDRTLHGFMPHVKCLKRDHDRTVHSPWFDEDGLKGPC